VLVGVAHQPRYRFAFGVDAKNPKVAHDPFSDREAVLEAIDRALKVNRATIREQAILHLREASLSSLPLCAPDPALLNPTVWIKDWDEQMAWSPHKPGYTTR